MTIRLNYCFFFLWALFFKVDINNLLRKQSNEELIKYEYYFSDILRGLLMAFQRDIDDNEDPLCLFVAQVKLLLQTFSVARPSSFIFSQCPDFLSYFLQLPLDFLTVWSGVEAVVVIIHITVSFLCRFNCRVGKCCDKVSKKDSSKKIFHLNSCEQFQERK